MDDLFYRIAERVEEGGNKIIALHNAVVDVVYQIPLTQAQFAQKFAFGEQRFQGPKHERIGGGGINFALTAASLGCNGIAFAGFMDGHARGLLDRIRAENKLSFPILWKQTPNRRNTIMELADSNVLLHDTSASVVEVAELINRVKKLLPGEYDWIASCSFYDSITFPLLGITRKFFLDSGYGYPRRENNMISRLCRAIASKSLTEFIIAANETELSNISDEFGKTDGSIIQKGNFIANKLSDEAGSRISILLHTTSFSTVFEPCNKDNWIVPCIDITVKRRTNAGDTHAGAFMTAYDSTDDFRLAAFFANAATAKRLATDELPTKENTADFLKHARLKNLKISGASSLNLEDFRAIMSSRKASSAYMPTFPGATLPAR